jgi:hypothetical protein
MEKKSGSQGASRVLSFAMNKLGYLVIGTLFVLACQTVTKSDIRYNEGVWATYFAVPSNGLEFACDNGPLNWNGGTGDCFFAGSLSTNSNELASAVFPGVSTRGKLYLWRLPGPAHQGFAL